MSRKATVGERGLRLGRNTLAVSLSATLDVEEAPAPYDIQAAALAAIAGDPPGRYNHSGLGSVWVVARRSTTLHKVETAQSLNR